MGSLKSVGWTSSYSNQNALERWRNKCEMFL